MRRLTPCFVVYNAPLAATDSERPLVRPIRLFRRWFSWLTWLVIAFCVALIAQYWRTPTGSNWAALSWLLPIAVSVSLVFTALWEMVGSGRGAQRPNRSAQKRVHQRRTPKDPKVHLHELRRSREYWAIMLRLPPEGACDAAQRVRWEVFDLYRAPPLPLPGCGEGRCRCGYSGLKERRRRDVLPVALDRDRRAGVVITYRPQVLIDREPAPTGSLPEMLHP